MILQMISLPDTSPLNSKLIQSTLFFFLISPAGCSLGISNIRCNLKFGLSLQTGFTQSCPSRLVAFPPDQLLTQTCATISSVARIAAVACSLAVWLLFQAPLPTAASGPITSVPAKRSHSQNESRTPCNTLHTSSPIPVQLMSSSSHSSPASLPPPPPAFSLIPPDMPNTSIPDTRLAEGRPGAPLCLECSSSRYLRASLPHVLRGLLNEAHLD